MKDGPHSPPTRITRRTIVLAATLIPGALLTLALLGHMLLQGSPSTLFVTGTPHTRISTGSSTGEQSSPGQSVGLALAGPVITDTNGVESVTANGASFHHIQKSPNGTIGTKVEGRRVYVYNTNFPYTQGAFVELFPKASQDTLAQAITKAVLGGYNPADCPIGPAHTIAGTIPAAAQTASITYSATNQYTTAPGPIDPSKCPQDYTTVEGPSYFIVYPNHPDKLVFFMLTPGIYPADPTVGSPLWIQTFSLD